jgi:hypothetical protein
MRGVGAALLRGAFHRRKGVGQGGLSGHYARAPSARQASHGTVHAFDSSALRR